MCVDPNLREYDNFLFKIVKMQLLSAKVQLFVNRLGEAFQQLQPTPNLVGNHWGVV